MLSGAGESGKSTIVKQMKILHIQGGFQEEYGIIITSCIFFLKTVWDQSVVVSNFDMIRNVGIPASQQTQAW